MHAEAARKVQCRRYKNSTGYQISNEMPNCPQITFSTWICGIMQIFINLINANKAVITAIALGIIILHTMLSASIQQQRNQDERGWGDEYQSVVFAMITAVTLVHTRLKGRSLAMAIMCEHARTENSNRV